MLDFLIVGAGLFGATCARALADRGRRVLVLERLPHVAGMAHTEMRGGQLMQAHGGHIFHTNDRRLWEFVNRFGEWRQYTHKVMAMAGGVVYSFPPNRMTYQQLGLDPCAPEAESVLRAKFFAGYTAKMWGRPIDQVPASTLARIPIRATWDDRYFTDRYQGLPAAGYTALVAEMLRGIPVRLGVDYLEQRTWWDEQASRTIYTGAVDALLGWQLGRLEYRSLRFEHRRAPEADWQGCATLNFCDAAVPWLRVEEWRHWWPPEPGAAGSWITTTYPGGDEPLYPVADGANQALYADYVKLAASQHPQVVLGGRLGHYRYYDMHQAIAAALHLAEGLVN